MTKSFVSIATCEICGEETGELLLDRRIKKSLEMHTQAGICDECQKKIDNNLSLLCDNCGGFLVVKASVAKKMIKNFKKGMKFKIRKCPHCTGNGEIEF